MIVSHCAARNKLRASRHHLEPAFHIQKGFHRFLKKSRKPSLISIQFSGVYLPVSFTTLSFMKSVPLYIALLANNAIVLVIVFSSCIWLIGLFRSFVLSCDYNIQEDCTCSYPFSACIVA